MLLRSRLKVAASFSFSLFSFSWNFFGCKEAVKKTANSLLLARQESRGWRSHQQQYYLAMIIITEECIQRETTIELDSSCTLIIIISEIQCVCVYAVQWAWDLKNPTSAPGRTSCRKRWNLMIMSTGSGASGHSANGAHCTHSMMNDSIRDWQINIQTEQTFCLFYFPSSLLTLLTVHVGPSYLHSSYSTECRLYRQDKTMLLTSRTRRTKLDVHCHARDSIFKFDSTAE